jgi:hypothetical protein
MSNEDEPGIQVWEWILKRWPNATSDDVVCIAADLRIYAEGMAESEDEERRNAINE